MAILNPCVSCNKDVKSTRHAIKCLLCLQLVHRTCTDITSSVLTWEKKNGRDVNWHCDPCLKYITNNEDVCPCSFCNQRRKDTPSVLTPWTMIRTSEASGIKTDIISIKEVIDNDLEAEGINATSTEQVSEIGLIDLDVIKKEDSNKSNTIYSIYEPIEECPQCCTKLVPEQFTVNVVTAIMKTTCHCGLSLEIDPKPTFLKKYSRKRK